jgi:Helix-turn-helix domain
LRARILIWSDEPMANSTATVTPLGVRVYSEMVEMARFSDHLFHGSQATLAERVGCSRGAVNRSIRDLRDAGWIIRKPQTLPSGAVIRKTKVWGFAPGRRRLLHDGLRPGNLRSSRSTLTGKKKVSCRSNQVPSGRARVRRGDGSLWVGRFVAACQRSGVEKPSRHCRAYAGGRFKNEQRRGAPDYELWDLLRSLVAIERYRHRVREARRPPTREERIAAAVAESARRAEEVARWYREHPESIPEMPPDYVPVDERPSGCDGEELRKTLQIRPAVLPARHVDERGMRRASFPRGNFGNESGGFQ